MIISVLLSTLCIEANLEKTVRQIGDSGIYIEIILTGNIKEKGIEELKVAAKKLADIIQEGLPSMSDKYKELYSFYLEDFHKNGLTMPHYGKLL